MCRVFELTDKIYLFFLWFFCEMKIYAKNHSENSNGTQIALVLCPLGGSVAVASRPQTFHFTMATSFKNSQQAELWITGHSGWFSVISCPGRTASETYPWITCLFEPQDLAAPISEAHVISLETLWSVKTVIETCAQVCDASSAAVNSSANSFTGIPFCSLLCAHFCLYPPTQCPVILFRRLPGKHLRWDFSNPSLHSIGNPIINLLIPNPYFLEGCTTVQLTEL